MVTWLHYTTAERFAFDQTFQDANAEEPGVFVYPENSRGVAWEGRRRIEIEAPIGAAVFVQAFSDGNIRGAHGEPLPGFEEWLIPAREFSRCRIIDPEEG